VLYFLGGGCFLDLGVLLHVRVLDDFFLDVGGWLWFLRTRRDRLLRVTRHARALLSRHQINQLAAGARQKRLSLLRYNPLRMSGLGALSIASAEDFPARASLQALATRRLRQILRRLPLGDSRRDRRRRFRSHNLMCP